jgi:nucleotide-binding universal stress UspA family protein
MWGLAMKYLVSVDFSDITNLVVRSAKVFATKLNAQLELLHVIAPFTYLPYPEGLSIDIVDMNIIQKAEENAKNLASEKLSALVDYLQPVKANSKVIVDTPFAEIISQEAENNNMDGIFLGGHSKNLIEKILVGSTTEDVVKSSKVSSIVIKAKEIEKLDHLLVAYDFTNICDKMLDFIFDTFKSVKPKITLLHVDKGINIQISPDISQTLEQSVNYAKLKKLNDIKNKFSEFYSFSYEIINDNDIAKTLEEFANHVNPDIIFVASKRPKLLERIFGSVETIRILRQSTYPLYIFKTEG